MKKNIKRGGLRAFVKSVKATRKSAAPAAMKTGGMKMKCPVCDRAAGAECVTPTGAKAHMHSARYYGFTTGGSLQRQRVTFQRAARAAAKRTGPSQRTAAERAAIDKRAADDTKAKRKPARKGKKAEAKKPKLQPIGAALAPLVATTAGNKGRDRSLVLDGAALHASPGVPVVAVDKIKIGKRHRIDFKHVPALVQSINERGGLIQPISVKPDFSLIDGESRIRAWGLSRFAGQPIPYHVIDVDSILNGEWDANAVRKDFTLEEAAAIKREVDKAFEKLNAARASSERAAPGRKATNAAGRAADRAAKFTGVKRETMRKVEAVIDAAERQPELFGKLREDMNRTNKVDAPYRRLKVLTQAAEIRNSPPTLPMKGPYRGGIIDPPWPAEPEEDDPERLARGYYPYPTMSIKELCAIDVPSIMHADCVVGLWITNFHLALGHHLPLLAAWGLRPVTIRSWIKDRIGRGQVLRGQSEHMIICRRGSPTIEANNLTTFFHAAVNAKAHSQKPQKAYDDFVRMVASERYFSLFETTDRGENWDSHGDQVGKFAPAIARAAEAEVIAEAKADAPEKSEPGMVFTIRTVGSSLNEYQGPHGHYLSLVINADGRQHTACECGERFSIVDACDVPKVEAEVIAHWQTVDPPNRSIRNVMAPAGHVISMTLDHVSAEKSYSVATCQCGWLRRERRALSSDVKLDAKIDAHWAEFRTVPIEPPAAADAALFDDADEQAALAQIDAGDAPARADAALILAQRALVHAGKKSLTLTDLGRERLAALNATIVPASPVVAAEPHQVDLEEAIAAKAPTAGTLEEDIPDFLRRKAEAAA